MTDNWSLLTFIAGAVAIVVLVFIVPVLTAEWFSAQDNLQKEIICNDLDMEAVYDGILIQYVKYCSDEQQICKLGYTDGFKTLKDCEKIVGVKK